MANVSTAKPKLEAEKLATAQPQITRMSVLAPALGWLIPGAGHLIQRRWIRGLLLMASIVTMFLLGLAMQGRVYRPNGGDILDILGFVGDLGSGGLYIVTRAMELGGGPAARATADYGKVFIIVA